MDATKNEYTLVTIDANGNRVDETLLEIVDTNALMVLIDHTPADCHFSAFRHDAQAIARQRAIVDKFLTASDEELLADDPAPNVEKRLHMAELNITRAYSALGTIRFWAGSVAELITLARTMVGDYDDTSIGNDVTLWVRTDF